MLSQSSRSILHALLLVALALPLLGCGAAQQAGKARKMNDFKQLALALHNHHDVHNRGPGSWDELMTLANGDAGLTATLTRLKGDGVVFYCNQTFKEATAGASNSIFAHEAAAAESGGIVALMDGSVQEFTADQFQQLLKNQTELSPVTVAEKSS